MDGLWRFDQEAIRLIHVEGHRPWLDPFFFVVSSTGLGWVQILLILLLTVRWGNLRREPTRADPNQPGRPTKEWSRFGLTIPLLAGYVATGVVNAAIKQGIERERPSNLSWANPQETFFYNSFSSGHTSTSFGVATVLWWLSRETPYAWVGRVGWVWAALVGFSRIYRGVHWPTDVVAGAAVGIVMGTAVALWWQGRVSRDE
jgi:undecaprenyl-diphosphatase